ncbi:MAG: hypothetical protein K0U93_16610 [Gammaproteobacteria bacterium]|nr:hypothetical protein [Gammaproteobacteria bacterium]
MKFRSLAFVLALATSPLQSANAFFIEVFDFGRGASGFVDMDSAIAAMVTPVATGSATTVDFAKGSNLGNFAGDQPFPGALPDFFGVHVSGDIVIPGGTAYFGVNHDDGTRLLIDGIQVINFDPPTAPRNTLGSVALSPGRHAVDLYLYENTGVASLEFFTSDANGAVGALVAAAPNGIPEPGSLALLMLGGLGIGLIGRRSVRRRSRVRRGAC